MRFAGSCTLWWHTLYKAKSNCLNVISIGRLGNVPCYFVVCATLLGQKSRTTQRIPISALPTLFLYRHKQIRWTNKRIAQSGVHPISVHLNDPSRSLSNKIKAESNYMRGMRNSLCYHSNIALWRRRNIAKYRRKSCLHTPALIGKWLFVLFAGFWPGTRLCHQMVRHYPTI